jgi:hypothetical protein
MNLTREDRELAEKFSGPVLSIEMEAATEDDFSEEEMLRAVRDAGFDFRRSRSGHVFLLNTQEAE